MPTTQKRQVGNWTYVLRCDRNLPTEQQSVFTLRPMTLPERMVAVDAYDRDGDKPAMMNAVLSCLVGTQNFPTDMPAPLPADRDGRIAHIDLMHEAHMIELGNEIWAKSFPKMAEPMTAAALPEEPAA